MTPLEIIKAVAEKSIGHGPQILAYLGVESVDAAMSKRKFTLPGCTCDKPKARLSNPDIGKGGSDSCQCFAQNGWQDFVRMVAIVKGLENDDAAIEVAKIVGYEIPQVEKAGSKDPSHGLKLVAFQKLLALGYLKAKPGISLEGLEKLSPMMGEKLRKRVICFPVYSSTDGTQKPPVNYISAPADGSTFEYEKHGEVCTPKMLTQYRGRNGLVGSREHIDTLVAGNVNGLRILITAGPGDLAAAHSAGIPDGIIAITQAFGERGIPSDSANGSKGIVDLIATTRCEILIAYDCDDAGKAAAPKLASHLARRGCTVKTINLERLGLPGKDIRDFIAAGATMPQIIGLADSTEPTIASDEANDGGRTLYSFENLDGSGLTDLANARRFIEQYSKELLFVPEWKKWLSWDGRHWADDSGIGARQRANFYAESLWKSLAKMGPKLPETAFGRLCSFVKATNQSNKIEAFMKLSQVDNRVVSPVRELNAVRHLLNCQNGTIDLTTGNLKPHDPADRITQICSVSYDPSASCPKWLGHLDLVFAGSEPLIRYVQQILGYAISADGGEHIFPVAYGGGRNGKSTIWSVVVECLGDYAALANECLLLGNQKNHPTEVAALYQKRFVAISEPPQGAKLREARVKELTGERQITARRMNEDFWTFERTHTFWLSTNHKPKISGADDGIWSRVKLIPFLEKITNKVTPIPNFDKWLAENEGPAILAWLVQGYLDYRASGGFAEPDEVKNATENYREDSDVITQFLKELCDVNDLSAETTAAALFASYRDNFGGKWNQTAFGKAIVAKGFDKHSPSSGPNRKKIVYRGISLLDQPIDREQETPGKQDLPTVADSLPVDNENPIRIGNRGSNYRQLSANFENGTRQPVKHAAEIEL